jgi:dihydrolipoamide dehydrogenase
LSRPYDITILGTGPGGYIAALRAAHLGASVAVVEKSHLGGTCLNNGCIPSKALLASAELLHRVAHADQLGVRVDGQASVDWPAVQKRKDGVLRRLRGGIGSLFKARGVDVHQGVGRCDGPGRIAVTGDDGGETVIEHGSLVLATGSTPSRIPGWPEDPALVCTTDEALHWDTLPERLMIVGGGVIGCEFACMLQPMGVEVTLVEMMPSLLCEMDDDLGPVLAKILAGRGVAIHTDTKVAELSVSDGLASATLETGETIAADRVLVATGRRPATAEIGLETIGLETDRGFVRVDDRMATGVKGVYCIGDANGRCLLAHAASAQGIVAVDNALGHDATQHRPIPWAVYTFPEIAGVGMTAEQARAKQIPVSVGQFPIGHLGKAMAVGETEGFVKVVRDRRTDALLGVHMIGHNVTECIAAAGAMIGMRATTTDLAETVFAHPTISESIKESAEDALSSALHLPPRKIARVRAES